MEIKKPDTIREMMPLSISDGGMSVNHGKENLEWSIFATISYFDYFEIPLTPFEIWKYLLFANKPYSLYDVAQCLKGSQKVDQKCACVQGMYVLRGREEHVWKRHERYIIAERKYRRALSMTRLFAWFPFVRMVAVVNTLPLSASRDESDIDFFIIVQAGWVWFVRGLATFFMLIMGKRPREGKMKDAICLSFFCADNSLNLEHVQLPLKKGFPDIYLCSWIATCMPLYSEQKTYERFYDENAWISGVLPNRTQIIPNRCRIVSMRSALRFFKSNIERIFSLIPIVEKISQRLQYAILPKPLRQSMNTSTHVIMHNDMIKCHLIDRRDEIREAWFEKMEKYGHVS